MEQAEAAANPDRAAELVDENSIAWKEILVSLRINGGRTVARLARDVNLLPKAVEGYVGVMATRGLVLLGSTRRGGRRCFRP